MSWNFADSSQDRHFTVLFKDSVSEEEWTLLWDNPWSPALIRETPSDPLGMEQTKEIAFYNGGEKVSSFYLYFLRDVAKGIKERVAMYSYYLPAIRIDISRNKVKHVYDDWEIIRTGTVKKEESNGDP